MGDDAGLVNRCLFVLLSSVAFVTTPVRAYEGEVQRDPQDAGVHVPVLTKAPELLQFVKADYPPDATAQGIEGKVRLAVTIDAEGNVADVQVIEGAGYGFDEAAVAAVRQFRFSPAEVDHVPSPVQIEYVYHFVLEVRDAGTPELTDGGVAEAPLETAILEGEVIARGSRTRVPAATVRCGIDENATEATTDADGRFSLQVPAGTCEVKVYASGFRLFETKEALQANSRLEVVYHLIPTAIGYETVVRGTREKKEVVRRTVERQEIQRVPGTFGDPVRVIQNFPGVARSPFGLGQLIVRGASPDQTRTMFDGVEIPLLFHLGGGPSVVNAEFLERVDFYPGGFGSRYGRAVGGIVDVGTRRGASDTWHGSVEVSLLNTSVFVEAPVAENVSVAAAARRSYIDAILPAVLPQDPEGGSLLVLPVYWDYQVRMDIGARRGEANQDGASSFYLMAFGSDDLLRVIATGGARNRDVQLDVHTVFHRLKGDWTWRKGKLTSVFAPYLGYDLGGFSFGDFFINGNIYNMGAREDFEIAWNSTVTSRFGFDLLFQHVVAEAELPVFGGVQYPSFPGDDPETEPQSFRRVINAFDGALFAELDLKLGIFTFTPGVRATHARIYGQERQIAEPRLWVRAEPTAALAIKGSVGLYMQPPDPASFEPPPLGNPNLVHEKAFQASLGFEQKLSDVVRVDLTGYYNRRYDLTVSPGPREQQEDGSFLLYQYANDGLGRAYGLELMLKHDITREFFGWIAYTLNRTELRRSNNPNPDAKPGYTIAPYDQTHIMTAVGSYRLPGGWELGARFRLVTGNPSTPLEHQYDLYNVDSNSFSTTRGELYSTRLKPFHQLDVRVDKNFLFESWTLNLYLDVQNVYNAQNVEARYTDYRGRIEYEVPGIPILPVIGAKGSF